MNIYFRAKHIWNLAYDPYRMIDQSCHISFVCGINNHFLTDFEKLCTQRKEINKM